MTNQCNAGEATFASHSSLALQQQERQQSVKDANNQPAQLRPGRVGIPLQLGPEATGAEGSNDQAAYQHKVMFASRSSSALQQQKRQLVQKPSFHIREGRKNLLKVAVSPGNTIRTSPCPKMPRFEGWSAPLKVQGPRAPLGEAPGTQTWPAVQVQQAVQQLLRLLRYGRRTATAATSRCAKWLRL